MSNARNMTLLCGDGSVASTVGLGTFPLQGEMLAKTIVEAYDCGYRLFDTADDYRGEPGIGLALRQLEQNGIRRDQVFIQTKISDNSACAGDALTAVYFNSNSYFMKRHTVAEIVREKVNKSLRDIGTDYLDSLLIHYPYQPYSVEIWRELISLKDEGLVRYIGVSNYRRRHIEELLRETGVPPQINEMYISPIATKSEEIDFCRTNNCLPIAYSPLMDLTSHRLPTDILEKIAKRHDKTTAQVILRWNLERGCVPLPKTKSKSRLSENFNVFSFSLDREEVSLISSLNRNYQYCVESRICPGL